MITPEKFTEMETFQRKCTTYLKETTLPIKRQHSENVEKYLNNFIKFPGALSIVSVFFISSDFVKNPIFALIGIIFIVISLLISLNAMRKSVSNDFYFYKKIEMTEKPIVYFSRKLTQFSRNELEEKELILAYDKLQDSYRENSINSDVEDKKSNILDFTKNSINISFTLLTIGIVFCFLSAIDITCILKII